MIEIREAQLADVPSVIVLVTEVLGEFGLEFGKGADTDDQLRELPGSYTAHGGAFWIAERERELLGTCGMFPVAPGTFELRKMYLRSSSRGLGVGGRLFETSIAWARAAGAKHVVLDTADQMTRAIEFYEARGFVRDDSQKRGARCTRGYRLDL